MISDLASRSGQTTFRLYLLGPFRLERDGEPIRLSTRKVESLLAYLVLHPESHSREKLAALFWGDTSDAQARASLRNALPTLRKQLGEEVLVVDRESVQFNQEFSIWIDVRELEALRWRIDQHYPNSPNSPILSLYLGDLLSDFYDEWLTADREHYRSLYLETLLNLVRHFRAQSDYVQAISVAQKILTLEPTHEAAQQNLMVCYQASGQRELALRQYEICRQVLQDELGVAPSAETTALYDQIKQTASTVSDAHLTNVPTPLTSFVGREKEIESLKKALTDSGAATRLVTLTGPGGAGKTRLAIQVARAELNEFADGVWWVELAALTDSAFLLPTIAKACGLTETPGQSLNDTLNAQLKTKRVLLVLDNCEHLISAIADFAYQLLRHCPQVKILTTSREALNVVGESVWPVAPLETVSEAVRLFAERAAAVKVGFKVDETNAGAIAQVCQQLDGLPLAVELAAARIKVLSPQQIAARLDDRFTLLAGGNRAALPHHQTLQAAMEWSYELLDEVEQKLFRCLAVFADGFTLEAIGTVWGAETDGSMGEESPRRPRSPTPLLELLSRLIDKSLVNVSDSRYRLLETIRQYAAGKLNATGEADSLADRHLAWCVQLAEQAEEQFGGATQAAWLDRLETEHENLRTALHWSLQHNEAELGLRLSSAVWQFWGYRGYMTEGRDWLAQLLALPAANALTDIRAKAFARAGVLAIRQSDYPTAGSLLQLSLDLYRNLSHPAGIAFALHYLGWVANAFGQFAAARERYEESLAIRRTLGNSSQRDVAETLANLGMLAFTEGDYQAARAYQEESLHLKSELGLTWGKLFSHWQLATNLIALADYAGAQLQLQQAIVGAQTMGERLILAYVFETLAWLIPLTDSGRLTLAPQFWGAADSLREAIAAPQPPQWRKHCARLVEQLRAQLGSEYDSAWAEGRKLTLERSVEEALVFLAK